MPDGPEVIQLKDVWLQANKTPTDMLAAASGLRGLEVTTLHTDLLEKMSDKTDSASHPTLRCVTPGTLPLPSP